MNNQLLIHIGYHKTATSWLQNYFFSHPDLAMVQPFSRKQDLRPHLTLPGSLNFDPDQSRSYFYQKLADRVTSGQVPVLSYEALVANPHGGAKYKSKAMADRLWSVFPEARIFIVIREQREMIFSTYRQFIKIGGTCSLQDYLKSADKSGNRIQPWIWEHFCYNELIAYYQQLYGSSRVLVLPYELFKQTPLDFLSDLALFSGVDAQRICELELPVSLVSNSGLSKMATELRRYSNRLLHFAGVSGGSFFLPAKTNQRLHALCSAIDRHLPDSLSSKADKQARLLIDRWVNGRYCEANQHLMELTGLPLQRLGYDV